MRASRIFLAAVLSIAAACSGEQGDTGVSGANGADAPSAGTISGNVTDATAGSALAGVAVDVKTTGGDALATATTDANGDYSVEAPIGTVSVTFSKQYFTSPGALLVGVVGGGSTTANATMAEAATGKPSVSVTAAKTDAGYGSTVAVTASATDPNGDTLTYTWTNATATGTNAPTATATLPTMATAFASRLESPTAAPSQYISGYKLEDGRLGIVPILPDTRGTLSVTVAVADGRGQTASKSVSIDAASVLTGARNVAIGTRVYLNSGHDGAQTWTAVVPSDATSAAALDDTTIRTPSFVADKAGTYTVTEGANSITVYAGDWKGAIENGSGTSIVVASDCTVCHNGTIAPDNFTPWAATPHATMLTRGLAGGNGTSYGASCIVCHTVGNDTGVVNNGFDDVAAANGWTFPAYSATAWTNMPAAVKRLSNIQCENCHGPNTSGAHQNSKPAANGGAGDYKSARISYSSEVCATCHASGTGHHNYSEWSSADPTTGYSHSKRFESAASGTGLNAHCGRCHAAQGFVAYSAQVKGGNPGNITDATVLADVTSANVEPVTCTACHDPHDATNPSQLRSVSNNFGDTALLASGFTVYGAGKGALCMTCHNSRNGRHDDGAAPTSYSAPHQACQTDVFAGRNGYFLGASTVMLSKHAAIEDTCVGCHMARNPETHVSHGSAAVSTHAFRVTDDNRATLCAGCHATGVDGEALAASFEANLASLASKITAAVKAKIDAAGNVTVLAYDEATDSYSTATPIAASAITVSAIEEIHGQIGFKLTLSAPMDFTFGTTTKSLSTFGVRSGELTTDGTNAVFAKTSNITKAGWNYFLVEGDQSKSLHNPSFVTSLLNATMAADLSL